MQRLYVIWLSPSLLCVVAATGHLRAKQTQAPGHPQMHNQAVAIIQAKQQILAATFNRFDPVSAQMGGQCRVHRPAQPVLTYPYLLDATPQDARLQSSANGFDFGQLRQLFRLARLAV